MARFGGLRVSSSAPVSTSGATTATVVQLDLSTLAPLPDNCVLHVKGILIGKDTSNNGISLESAATFRRISGTTTARGSVLALVAPVGDAALSLVALVLDVSGSVLRLRATGVALVDISWDGFLEIYSTTFTG